MDFIRSLIGAPTTGSRPLASPDDSVYPLHLLDDTKTLRQIVVTWTLRFDDVLDVEMLETSLSRLLEIGDWKKLGGRLRLKGDARLEIHVPRIFTVQRPAVSYTRNISGVSIHQDPVAKFLPHPTDYPSIQRDPKEFHVLAAHQDAPRTLEDFTSSDVPMLSVHFTKFTDATIVGISWPHVLMDVMGQQALLKAWSLVLAGKVSDVPPNFDARQDALQKAVDMDKSKEPYRLTPMKLQGFALLTFGLHFAWDLLWNWSVESKTIFLPCSAVEQLKRKAENDLRGEGSSSAKLFVSDGDVLTAWITSIVANSQPKPRPITMMHATNARFRLSFLQQAKGVFIQNMALASFTFLLAEEAKGLFGWIAHKNRLQLSEQVTEGQIVAQYRALQEPAQRGDPSIIYGPANALLLVFTNWTRANFFECINFESAVVRASNDNKVSSKPPGTITYHHASSMETSQIARNVLVILGKDLQGNYWLSGTFNESFWNELRKAVDEMSA